MDIAELLAPWTEIIRDQIPDLELFDAHTHLGKNDPDGFRQSPEELLAVLRMAGARGCFVFPMHEPAGYPPANDMVIAAANESDGMFVPFCRVNPHDHAVAEAERALAAGARGIKLHPRAEQFTLDHPAVQSLFALADERSLPILIHAGRGIRALGEHVVGHAGRYGNARVILAHAAVSDLAWIWRAAAELPNLLFDTAWWLTTDLRTLFTLVPPGQILFASDAPYGHTAGGAALQFRIALQAGLSAEQIRLIASGQSLRIAAGESLEPAGPAVGERDSASHVLLDRVAELIQLSSILWIRGGDGTEMLSLARLACEVPAGIDDAPVFAGVRSLLDAFERATIEDANDRRRLTLLLTAAAVARTPDVPVPSFS